MATEFFSAIIINSREPERLAAFYRDILEIPLAEAEHGGPKHYEAQLGDLHFAIRAYRGEPGGAGAVEIGIQVFELASLIERIEGKGYGPVNPPVERGFALMTGIKDPDGNTIWLTELTEQWLQYMEERRNSGADIYQKWKQLKG